jgi:pimeloyl-ACP methyl ester carboxylesterase
MTGTYSFWHFVHKDPALRPPVKAADRLGEVGQRCLVLTGELDLPEFREIGVFLGEKLERCTRLEIPQAGHLANMENPKCFNEWVLDFLRK